MKENKNPNKNKATPQDKKVFAYSLYMKGMTQSEIAKTLGVLDNIVSKWALAGKWKDIRAATAATPRNVAKNLLAEINAITTAAEKEGRRVSSGECDDISKLAAAMQKIDRTYDLIVYTSIMEDFMVFMAQQDVDAAKSTQPFAQEFIQQTAKKLSSL